MNDMYKTTRISGSLYMDSWMAVFMTNHIISQNAADKLKWLVQYTTLIGIIYLKTKQ